MNEAIKPSKNVNDVVFKASSVAALDAYDRHGMIPITLSAIIITNGEPELIPVLKNANHDIRAFNGEEIEAGLDPVVTFVRSHPGSRVLLFFFSAFAEGDILIKETNEVRSIETIIVAARTERKEGKTESYEVKKGEKGVEFTPLNTGGYGKWLAEAPADDLAALTAQFILDKVWVSYVLKRNIALIPIYG